MGEDATISAVAIDRGVWQSKQASAVIGWETSARNKDESLKERKGRKECEVLGSVS